MRSVWTGGCRGVILGVAVNQLLNLLASYCLRLGYYAPCLVSWPERSGGELNGGAGGDLRLRGGMAPGRKIAQEMTGKGANGQDVPQQKRSRLTLCMSAGSFTRKDS